MTGPEGTDFGRSARVARLAERLARHTPRIERDPARRWAAVALIVVPDPDALLLIRRAERPGDPWSGQMGLPGGRHASSDVTLMETAIRETSEEVGIVLASAQCIGVLDDVAPRTPVLPPIAVRPYVFAVPARPAIAINDEVAAAHWVLLDDLLHPGTYRPAEVRVQDRTYRVGAYHVADAVVWGMTERILRMIAPYL